jgi:outer membrane protein assembly factor BamA
VRIYCDVEPYTNNLQIPIDSLQYGPYQLYFSHKPFLRPRVITSNTKIIPGHYFNESEVHDTYNNFGGLRAAKYVNIRMQEMAPDSDNLNCLVVIKSNKRHSASAELEGTNSAGDLGAAASLTLQNRNIFHGSELLSLKVRGAFEAITGLEGYNDQNYVEYSGELGLTFPYSDMPFISKQLRHALRVTSELSILYDSQNRPEFHRRVLTGIFSYRWYTHNTKALNRIDLIDLNYVFMPWISDTFKKDYLENVDTRNSILKYNYQDLFIMKLGYTYTYNSMGNTTFSTYGKNAYAFRFNIETAGNVLYAFSHMLKQKRNSSNAYTLFNIAYAEYVKGDFDFSKNFVIDQRNSMACHFGLGIAYPYGNSSILPYEKRYFSGGANSVRGWSVRSLGPGTYNGGNGRIDFINQTGDIKLDLNLEYRTFLFWKLNGAVFIDGGNIWTIRNYSDQPGGQFHFDTFWKQIAFAYGLGLRFNFDYFILRLDGGMRAVNPSYTNHKEHFPIIYPKLSRDFAFHFAVGLPF